MITRPNEFLVPNVLVHFYTATTEYLILDYFFSFFNTTLIFIAIVATAKEERLNLAAVLKTGKFKQTAASYECFMLS